MIYLAGPYRGANAEEVQRNLGRIGLLSRLLVKLGAGPVSVHAAVHAGHYGDDADPAARRDGIAAAVRIAYGIGAIIALEQDGGGLSAGTAEEVMALNNGRPWSRQQTPQRGVAVVRWDDIGPAFQAQGLGDAWSALRPRKPVVSTVIDCPCGRWKQWVGGTDADPMPWCSGCGATQRHRTTNDEVAND